MKMKYFSKRKKSLKFFSYKLQSRAFWSSHQWISLAFLCLVTLLFADTNSFCLPNHRLWLRTKSRKCCLFWRIYRFERANLCLCSSRWTCRAVQLGNSAGYVSCTCCRRHVICVLHHFRQSKRVGLFFLKLKKKFTFSFSVWFCQNFYFMIENFFFWFLNE